MGSICSVIRPSKLLPKGEKVSLGSLSSLPIALTLGGTFRAKLNRELSARGIELNESVETTSFSQSLEALRTGSFAALLPDFANTHLSSKQFTAFDLPELKSTRRTIVLARRKQREDLVKFSDTLLSVLSAPNK